MRVPAVVRDLGRRIVELPPLAILALGWLTVIVYGFPGMMTMDSIQQLDEARKQVYTDLHPAVMARLWHYVDRIVAGPFGMLAIQTTLFLAGLYLLLRRAMRPRRAAVAACLLFLYPPILSPMGVIWKDCLMAGCLALGIAGILAERRGYKIAGLVALMIASAVRYNAPAATLPLIVILFTWLPTGTTWKLRIRRYALSTGAWLAVTITALGLGMALTDKPMHPWPSTLALFDTAGTLAELDGTLPDEELRPLFAGTQILIDRDFHAAIRRQYSPLNYEPLIFGDGHLWDVHISGTEPTPQARRDAMSRMFWETVPSNIGAYLRHRVATMTYVLGLHDGPVYSPVMTHRSQYEQILVNFKIAVAWSPLQARMQKRMLWVARQTPLFRPWLYLVVALVLLAFCRKHRDVFAILLSGIGLEAGLFVLAPTPDYRYSHWLVIATCIAIVMLVARRARPVEVPTVTG